MEKAKRLQVYDDRVKAVEGVFENAMFEYEEAARMAGKAVCRRCGVQTELDGTGHTCAMDVLPNFQYSRPPMCCGPHQSVVEFRCHWMWLDVVGFRLVSLDVVAAQFWWRSFHIFM